MAQKKVKSFEEAAIEQGKICRLCGKPITCSVYYQTARGFEHDGCPRKEQ